MWSGWVGRCGWGEVERTVFLLEGYHETIAFQDSCSERIIVAPSAAAFGIQKKIPRIGELFLLRRLLEKTTNEKTTTLATPQKKKVPGGTGRPAFFCSPLQYDVCRIANERFLNLILHNCGAYPRSNNDPKPSQRPVEAIKKDRVVKPPVQRYAQCSVCCDHLQEDPEQKGVFYCTQCWEIWKAQRHCTTTPPQHQHQRPFPPPFPPTPPSHPPRLP